MEEPVQVSAGSQALTDARQSVPLGEYESTTHTTLVPEQAWCPVAHAPGEQAVAVMLSTTPSQLSSTPLQVSGVGTRVTTFVGHTLLVPLQVSGGSHARTDSDGRHVVPSVLVTFA